MVNYIDGQFVANTNEQVSILQSGFGKSFESEVILHPLETAYLLSFGLTEVYENKKKMSIDQILKTFKTKAPKSIGKLPSANEQFILYSNLRSAGRIVRFNTHSVQYWRVYARGVGREQERAQILLRLVDSKWGVSVKSLNMQIAVARQLRMELVLAFIEDKTPSFVKVNKFNLD